jgi:hypothetical protein
MQEQSIDNFDEVLSSYKWCGLTLQQYTYSPFNCTIIFVLTHHILFLCWLFHQVGLPMTLAENTKYWTNETAENRTRPRMHSSVTRVVLPHVGTVLLVLLETKCQTVVFLCGAVVLMLLDGWKALIPGFEDKSSGVRFAFTGVISAVTGATTPVSKTAVDTMSFTSPELQVVLFVTVETPNQQ